MEDCNFAFLVPVKTQVGKFFLTARALMEEAERDQPRIGEERKKRKSKGEVWRSLDGEVFHTAFDQ